MRNNLRSVYKTTGIISTVCYCICFTIGCCNDTKTKDDLVLETLTNIELRYLSDGAHETEIVYDDEVSIMIGRYKDGLVSILINNLNNDKMSKSVIEGVNIPVGFLCFDLLCSLLKPVDDLCIIDSSDDGLWSSVKVDYRIPIELDKWRNLDVQIIQKRWEKLYRSDKLIIDWEFCNKNIKKTER